MSMEFKSMTQRHNLAAESVFDGLFIFVLVMWLEPCSDVFSFHRAELITSISVVLNPSCWMISLRVSNRAATADIKFIKCCLLLLLVVLVVVVVLLMILVYGNTEYCAGGKMEKNEMGGACGAYGGGERGAQGSGGET